MEWVIDLLQNSVFPIAMCVLLMWYIVRKDDKHAEEVEKLTSQNAEQIKTLTEHIDKTNENVNSLVSKIDLLLELEKRQ